MAELPIGEAAAKLGVSVETIRRWIRDGQLVARRDARGRYVVEVMQGSAGGDAATAGGPVPHRHVQAADLRRELLHTRELLDEVRRQRDQLEAQVEAQRRQIERDAAERAELRRLLEQAQEQLRALPGDRPSPADPLSE